MANGNQIPFAIPAIFSEHIRYWIVSGEQVFDGKRMSTGISAINAAVQEASAFVPGLLGEINRVVVVSMKPKKAAGGGGDLIAGEGGLRPHHVIADAVLGFLTPSSV